MRFSAGIHAHAVRHVVDCEVELVGDLPGLGAESDLAEQYFTQLRGGAVYKHAKRQHEHHNIEREKPA